MRGLVKGMFVMIIFCGLSTTVSAQFWNEWFRQKATQRKYLIQQIAALQVYSEYIQKGYRIAREGINIVNGFKDGEFGLHKTFFNSLRAVNPSIKKYRKVADIAVLEINVVRIFNQALRKLRTEQFLTTGELDYLESVYEKLLIDCTALVEELLVITTSGNYEMSDDQRIMRIDELYEQAIDHYRLSIEFSDEALQFNYSKKAELKDLKNVNSLHD